MKSTVISLFGIIAPVFYIIPTIVGGLLRPGYSHLSNSVSDLLASGAPNRIYLMIPFTVYPTFLSVFGFGLFAILRSKPPPLNSQTGLVGFILIGASMGILGILTMTIFPQDPHDTPMTTPGLMHLILVGVQAISAMAAILLIGFWFRSNGFSGYFIYSIVSFVVLLITGIISMIGVTQGSQFIGLFERLNVGAIVQWLVVIGIWFMLKLPLTN
jgi:hypothetical protein